MKKKNKMQKIKRAFKIILIKYKRIQNIILKTNGQKIIFYKY